MTLNPKQFEALKSRLMARNEPFVKGAISRVAGDIKQRGINIVDTIIDSTKSPIRRGFEATAEAFGAIPQTAINVLPNTAREKIKQVEEKVSQGFTALTDKIGSSQALIDWTMRNPEAAKGLEEVLATTSAGGAVAGSILAAEGGVRTTQKLSNSTVRLVDDIRQKVPSFTNNPQLANKATELLAKDIDGKVETILKETPTTKLDEYVKYAEDASKDPRALTPFDKVGDRMEQATKLLQAEMKRVGQAKSEFTQPLRQGFDSFNGQSLVDDLTSLHNRLPVSERAFVKGFIEKAKAVKTKFAADKLIDEVQDAVRTAGMQNVVPKGSSLQRQVSGIIEKFNTKLKDSLPPEYATLNTRYSSLKTATNALSRALGEVVEGQSTRGASLVKQFFSPSGKRAKVLFDYIKKNTGIDLAQETTLARFAMELFDDPRSRSLLEGVPKSAVGLIDKAIDFAVEKTGVGKGVQKALREAEVRKAKKLTK